MKVWVPHKYQQRGIDWLVSRPEAALFFAPGLGKTSTTLAAFLKLRSFGYNIKALVLAPLRVCQTTWLEEHLKWEQFCGLKIGLAHGKNKEKVLLDPQYDIVVLNYDGIQWAAPLLRKGNPFKMVVYDELTKMKHTNTRRFKLFKPLMPTFQFRWGLTGTPVSNGLMDVFGEMYALDLGARFGAYITHYRLKYFEQHPWDEWNWYLKPGMDAQIHKKIAEIAMYIDPEEWLELPDLLDIDVPVTLTPALRKQYKEFESLYLLSLNEQTTLVAAHAGILSGKLRQFLSGAIYDEQKNVVDIHTVKLDALDDLIDEMSGEPLMVAYNFTHELDRIRKRYPKALVFSGGMSETQAKETMAAWNTGMHPLLLVQPQSAAHGLNLQFGGSAICWFSLTYNLEDYIQLIARLHRQGQKSTVRNYRLIVEESMDTELAKALSMKGVTQDKVYAALLKI